MELRRAAAHHACRLNEGGRASAQQAAELAWSQVSSTSAGRAANVGDGGSASRAARLAWTQASSQFGQPLAVTPDERDRALQAAHLAWNARDLEVTADLYRLEGSILQTRPHSSAYFMLDPLKQRRCKLCTKSLGPKESMVAHYWASHGLFCLLCGGIPAGLSPARGYSPARILKHWQTSHGIEASAHDVFEAIKDAKVEALLWREQSVHRARAAVSRPDTSISARHGEHYKRRLKSEHDCTDGRKRHGIVHGIRALFQDIRRGRSESISNEKLRKMGSGPKREISVKQKPRRRWWQIGKQKRRKEKKQQKQPTRNTVRQRERRDVRRPAGMSASGVDAGKRN